MKPYANHSVCTPCWKAREGDRVPVSIAYETKWERCCWCGCSHRSGIYQRAMRKAAPHCTCE